MSFFTNKVVWITGASSGIGAELAQQLAQAGARLILTARNEAALAVVRGGCLKCSPDCTVLSADLSHPDVAENLHREAIAIYGKIDILINNAGVTQRSMAQDTPIVIDRQIMELDFFIPVMLSKNLLSHFKAQGGGQIVVISSMAGLMGFPQRSAYAAAKHALMGFFETMQVEHTIPGFFITIVSPGRIKTPISLSAITATGAPHGLMDQGQENGIPVAVCARKILRATAHRRKHIIIARGERILWWIKWFCPPLYYRIARNAGAR